MYQIPTIRAVHILSADTNNPRGPVAKQVTMCFKSLPDGSFSKSQMKNSGGGGGGGGAGLPPESNINTTLRQSVSLTAETDGDLLIEAAALTCGGELVKPLTTNTNSSSADHFKA